MRCRARHPEHGVCRQKALGETFRCGYHLRRQQNPAGHVDRYYEKKVFLGLVEPTDNWMTETEINALFTGRTKNDGRRIDHWTRR